MNSKFILSKGKNKITLNGEKILDENWLAKDNGRKLNVKYQNFDDLIEYNIYNRELMDTIKKDINNKRHIPLITQFKNQNKTKKRPRSAKNRTPTPYPNKNNKKTKANKKKKLKKKKIKE